MLVEVEINSQQIFENSQDSEKNKCIGEITYYNKGAILQVTEKGLDYVVCVVLKGGEVTNNSKIYLPETRPSRKFLTDKDYQDVIFANEMGVDFITVSSLSSAEDVLEIDRYFRQQMKENVKQVKTREKHYLNVKAYELLNYSMNDLYQMDANEVDKINSQVYDYFKIRENAINKEYLLDKAIEAIEKENNKVTSGNGYVDILLVLSIICTIIMVVGILTFIVI